MNTGWIQDEYRINAGYWEDDWNDHGATMAKVILNPILEQIRGGMGGMAFRRGVSGEVHLMKAPDMSRVKWSEAQQKHRQRFKLAVAYARSAMADGRVGALYAEQAERLGKRPFHLALSDYFKGRNLFLSTDQEG
jgi:hypothetical protein